MYEIFCTRCGSRRESPLSWRCRCGGPFTAETDVVFNRKDIFQGDLSVWRYRKFLPPVKEIVTFGEGLTPLQSIDSADYNVKVKLEYLMPTGSFKDRGSTVLMSAVKPIIAKNRIDKLVEDSSGNAGASIAAYSARANLKCEIFAPETISETKARQIKLYGAKLTLISGSRSKLSKAAEQEASKSFYASHIWNPYFIEGTKTAAYETAEFLRWKSPQYVFVPTSAGTLLLGFIKGFRHLVESDMVESFPKIVSVQCHQVSPVYHAFSGLRYKAPVKLNTVADALISTEPVRLEEMVASLRKVNGETEVVSEEEIISCTKELALKGFYVEPSSAVPYAAWKKRLLQGRIDREDTVIIPLTGSGFKAVLW